MKFTHTCLAMMAAAGLTMFTGCGDMSEPEVSQNEIDTPNEVATEPTPQDDVQYGAPERQDQPTYQSDYESGDNSFVTPENQNNEVRPEDQNDFGSPEDQNNVDTPENQNQSTFEGTIEEGEADFVTPDGEEGEVEIDDGEAEIDM